MTIHNTNPQTHSTLPARDDSDNACDAAGFLVQAIETANYAAMVLNGRRCVHGDTPKYIRWSCSHIEHYDSDAFEMKIDGLGTFEVVVREIEDSPDDDREENDRIASDVLVPFAHE